MAAPLSGGGIVSPVTDTPVDFHRANRRPDASLRALRYLQPVVGKLL